MKRLKSTHEAIEKIENEEHQPLVRKQKQVDETQNLRQIYHEALLFIADMKSYKENLHKKVQQLTFLPDNKIVNKNEQNIQNEIDKLQATLSSVDYHFKTDLNSDTKE